MLLTEIGLRPQAVIADLSRVDFCSAQSLRVLLEASAEAHAAGVPCAVVSDQRALQRPVTVLGVDHVLQLHRDLRAAQSWLTALRLVEESA
ncbi:hypothetical protein A4R44_08338 [Amycolatopsis sp. M39]|nr:hypothetical protein A4R44_08338 [Amycolatopsis sp. M39]